jgi:hypothetical protein
VSDLDLERLGELWRGDPQPEAIEELRRAAAAAKRRGPVKTMLDYALAVVMAAAVLFIIAVDRQVDTAFVGAVALLMLIFGQLRQRRFRRLELESLSGDTSSMIDQSIERVEATFKHASQGLLLLPPAITLGIVLGFVSDDATRPFFSRLGDNPLSALLLAAIMFIALPAMVVHLILTKRRSRRELERLHALREAYRKEENEADLAPEE